MAISRFGHSSRLVPALKISVCEQQPVYISVHYCSLHSSSAREVSKNVQRDSHLYSTQCPTRLSRSINTQMQTSGHFIYRKLSTCGLEWPKQAGHFCGIRATHTSSCMLSATSQPMLSSRRGRLSNLEDAKQYVATLSAVQRSTLDQALQEAKPDVHKEEDVSEDTCSREEEPTRNQLKLLCYQSALPFIGFGFLDNVIMITVGEYLDWTLGVTLGISTMAAAGLGNMISDLAGLGLADQVEAFCLRLGIPNPNPSSSQLKHKSSRWTILLGRCIGIAVGCIIGMAPLFWIDNPHKKDSEQSGK